MFKHTINFMTTVRNTVNKVRRNGEEVDRDILIATKELVEEFGFDKLTLAKVAKKASLAPNMFYKRYPDLEKLTEKFIKKYDYWFNDIFEIPFDKSKPLEYYKNVMLKLLESLNKNRAMQQILIYELSNDNPITRRTAKLRELDSDNGLKEYDEIFKGTGIDIRANTALIVAGIYYLILHKGRSSFCGIDMTTEDGMRRIRETVYAICDAMFRIAENRKNVTDIAKKLKEEKVDISTIGKCTGLSVEAIEAL